MISDDEKIASLAMIIGGVGVVTAILCMARPEQILIIISDMIVLLLGGRFLLIAFNDKRGCGGMS